MTSTSDIISDGLSKLGRADGGFLEGLVLYSPEYQAGKTKIVGPVFTVKFAPKSDSSAPKVKDNYIDQIPKDSVVFISQPAPHVNACYGGLMSLRAQILGAKGVLFARGTGTTAGGAVCFPSEINVDVKLQSAKQDATISPGGYIIADLDGVVFLPGDLAEQVLERIPELAAADDRCAEAIRGGMSVQEAFATFRGK
ncbi:4-hydroxy-4-methyl-2-oxoglutarate aldolase [Colletotrichum aenigma]|uniref:4-hydroxy-4-methyl-2-oxoglutarate aldolase n=1 Tax=Colletotrichum aenigma TaxID=1215731 RepID=UPI0018726CF3|nr:4-hydroxy-4-methyl-2-oxoglutarate aldolase [Colletotrichum aenigma]KAF5518582.1 4-hydroxy-4-methyl-2-oxoglutarate aldolase [Colletotrichum aenigma]